MKKDINQFLHNTEKWSNILKISAGIQGKILKVCLAIFLHYEGKG